MTKVEEEEVMYREYRPHQAESKDPKDSANHDSGARGEGDVGHRRCEVVVVVGPVIMSTAMMITLTTSGALLARVRFGRAAGWWTWTARVVLGQRQPLLA